MKKLNSSLILFFIALFFVSVFSQNKSGTQIQPRKLIDCHTAGSLPKGYFDLDFKFFSEGGLSTGIGVGITDRLSIGISYQLMNLIGNNKIKGQPFPAGLLKYRIMEESYYLPGLALGFDSQGSGSFQSAPNLSPRFYFKSKGVFAALSKSYLLLGQPLGFHLGINYSAVDNQATSEKKSDTHSSNRNINFYMGLDKSINEELAVFCEYDFALDDNYSANPLAGYLNFAVRYAIIKTFTLELDFKDILQSKKLYPISSSNGIKQPLIREIRIVLIENF